MKKEILKKIKDANILSAEELTELESKLGKEKETVKSPKGEVKEDVKPTETKPTEKVGEAPVEAPKEMTEAPTEETPMESAPAPVEGKPTEEMAPATPVEPTPGEEPMAPEGALPPDGVNPEQVPPTDVMTPANEGDMGSVSPGDLEQVKTTMSTLENKIRALEDVLSKLSVSGEPTEEDFGISGKGKTVANGQPNDDKVGSMIRKMGGFSK
jgi:hypothetical protein